MSGLNPVAMALRIVAGLSLVALAIWFGAASRSPWTIGLAAFALTVAMAATKEGFWRRPTEPDAAWLAKRLGGTALAETILAAILFFIAYGVASALGRAGPFATVGALDVGLTAGVLAVSLGLFGLVRLIEGDRTPTKVAFEALEQALRGTGAPAAVTDRGAWSDAVNALHALPTKAAPETLDHAVGVLLAVDGGLSPEALAETLDSLFADGVAPARRAAMRAAGRRLTDPRPPDSVDGPLSELLAAGLDDPQPDVRAEALAVAERMPTLSPSVRLALEAMATDAGDLHHLVEEEDADAEARAEASRARALLARHAAEPTAP